MSNAKPNSRWSDYPARRVRPEHLLNIRRLAEQHGQQAHAGTSRESDSDREAARPNLPRP